MKTPRTICFVQVGQIEVTIRKQRMDDDTDCPRDEFEFIIGIQGKEGFDWLNTDEMANVISAVGHAVRLLRKNEDCYAGSRITLRKLFETLDGPPEWVTKGWPAGAAETTEGFVGS